MNNAYFLLITYYLLLNNVSGCGAAGSALDWGSRGRRFKSCHSDQKSVDFVGGFFIQADRLGISSRRSRVYHQRRHAAFVSHHTYRCVSITVGLMICNGYTVDYIQNFVLMICNSCGNDDIQRQAVDFIYVL